MKNVFRSSTFFVCKQWMWKTADLLNYFLKVLFKSASSFCSLNQMFARLKFSVTRKHFLSFVASAWHSIFSSEQNKIPQMKLLGERRLQLLLKKVKRKNRLQDYLVPLHNKVPICLSFPPLRDGCIKMCPIWTVRKRDR